jgi:hypothetical protein
MELGEGRKGKRVIAHQQYSKIRYLCRWSIKGYVLTAIDKWGWKVKW